MVYVGSTNKTIQKRFNGHLSAYKGFKNPKPDKPTVSKITSFDLFNEYGVKKCKISELSSKMCDKKERDENSGDPRSRSITCSGKRVGRSKQRNSRAMHKLRASYLDVLGLVPLALEPLVSGLPVAGLRYEKTLENAGSFPLIALFRIRIFL